METITLLNGNDQLHTRPLPLLMVHDGQNFNPEFWKRVRLQTGLDFKPTSLRNMEAQPQRSDQVVRFLLCTSPWKMCYYDNAAWKNTLMLKSDHGIGFNVSAICYNCVEYNGLHIGDLKPHDRLAC